MDIINALRTGYLRVFNNIKHLRVVRDLRNDAIRSVREEEEMIKIGYGKLLLALQIYFAERQQADPYFVPPTINVGSGAVW